MNILFMQGVIHPEKGGIGRASYTLGSYFNARGHRVFYFTAKDSGFRLENHIVISGGNFSSTRANRDELSEVLRRHEIAVVIYQNALGREGSELAYHCHSTGAKLISAIHSTLLGGIKNLRFSKYALFTSKWMRWAAPLVEISEVKAVIVWMYKLKYRGHFHKLVKASDRVLVLSERIKQEIAEYLGHCPANVIAMPNPLPFPVVQVLPESKTKQVLWVGRVDHAKRLDLFLKIWRIVSVQRPDWRAVVVGDGSALADNIRSANLMGLTNITFAGFAPARQYYATSSILCFTSAYEGFPFVLLEAMAAGCVPMAFNSFLAADDIIDHGKNGLLIEPFDCNAYARSLGELMLAEPLRGAFASAAQEKAGQFSLESVGARWLTLLDEVTSRRHEAPAKKRYEAK